jgi:hypothetical protein
MISTSWLSVAICWDGGGCGVCDERSDAFVVVVALVKPYRSKMSSEAKYMITHVPITSA